MFPLAACLVAVALAKPINRAPHVSSTRGNRAKKGVGATERWFQNKWPCQEVEQLGIDWWYDWGPASACDALGSSGYVPMIWSGADIQDQLQRVNRSSQLLLGFNEPDNPTQSNMTVEEAIKLWPQLVATGMRLGSPAATASGKGTKWINAFMKSCDSLPDSACKVDVMAVHWYDPSCSVAGLREYVESFARFGRPVWITEFDCFKGDFAANEQFAAEALPLLLDGGLTSKVSIEAFAWYTTRQIPPNADYHGVSLFNDSVPGGEVQLTGLGEVFAEAGRSGWSGAQSSRNEIGRPGWASR